MGSGIGTTTPYKGIALREVLLEFKFLKAQLATNIDFHYDEFYHLSGYRIKISPKHGLMGIMKSAYSGWNWISFEQFLDEIPIEHQEQFLFHLDLFA